MARTLLVAIEEDMEEERAVIHEQLKINIYDLTSMNKFMYWVGLGVYHSGIEAYGTEYAYGAHDYPTSGVFEVEPQHCPGFTFRKSLTLGTVWLGPDKFREFVEAIACEYTGDSYHLLLKNCNHFCDDVCMRLVSVHIPRWINRLANIGSLCRCFFPDAFQGDEIHPFDYEAYKDDDAKCDQENFGHLAHPFTMLAPKKRHLVSFSALLYYSKQKNMFGDWKVHKVCKTLSKDKLKEL